MARGGCQLEVPLQMEELKSTNYVPIVPVGSRNAQTHLVPISKLTKNDNIISAWVLPMQRMTHATQLTHLHFTAQYVQFFMHAKITE